jgi:ABC-type iron transport system FetAB ATPase subunit
MNDLRVENLFFHNRGPYTFQVAAGTVAGLQGASGAGKTLLLRAMADLDPHEGEVGLGDMLCGQVPGPVWRKTVGLLPAEGFWWYDSVGEHFQVPVEECTVNLQRLGFGLEVLDWEVSRLSTGEKQRLAIVRLLQNRPRALLLDEPTASLDAENIERTESLLLHYCRQEQAPLLWVSHDPHQLERLADEQWLLESDGSLNQAGGGRDGR